MPAAQTVCASITESGRWGDEGMTPAVRWRASGGGCCRMRAGYARAWVMKSPRQRALWLFRRMRLQSRKP